MGGVSIIHLLVYAAILLLLVGRVDRGRVVAVEEALT